LIIKTLPELQKKLLRDRKKLQIQKEKFAELQDTIRKMGGDPAPWTPDFTERNKEIYRKWYKVSVTFKDLALEYKVSTSTISSICRTIAFNIRKRRIRASDYRA
jgi:Mor family transcriptional regulator